MKLELTPIQIHNVANTYMDGLNSKQLAAAIINLFAKYRRMQDSDPQELIYDLQRKLNKDAPKIKAITNVEVSDDNSAINVVMSALTRTLSCEQMLDFSHSQLTMGSVLSGNPLALTELDFCDLSHNLGSIFSFEPQLLKNYLNEVTTVQDLCNFVRKHRAEQGGSHGA